MGGEGDFLLRGYCFPFCLNLDVYNQALCDCIFGRLVLECKWVQMFVLLFKPEIKEFTKSSTPVKTFYFALNT